MSLMKCLILGRKTKSKKIKGFINWFTYGRIRMYQALLLKQLEGVHIPSERTVYRVMDQIGLNNRPKRKPNGLTKADREAMKSDDLLKRDSIPMFH